MDVEQSYIHNYDNSVAVKYGDPNIHFHLRWHNHKLCNLFKQKNISIVFQPKLKKNSRMTVTTRPHIAQSNRETPK